MKHKLLIALSAVGLMAQAQSYKESYVDWGGGSERFSSQVSTWSTNHKINDDDNFFISRQRPHYRFRNQNTQIRQDLTEANDKKLIAWVPINNTTNNALPDGVFDSECFTMWSYVTHWGNWTAPVGRIPGGFLDVAHKNGVAVSGVASVPFGSLTGSSWATELANYSKMDGAKVAQYFRYHGINGMGYNSEFSGGQSFLGNLRTMHANLVKAARVNDPLFENIWYDGTNDNGVTTFDQGLASHNDDTFGKSGSERTSLFFNYNWNRATLLNSSVSYARNIGRNPLDLYAGVNMQGNEPASNNWPLLKDYPISIGLWGAHSYNMFWESRGEKGSDPAIKQNTYLQRIERWFTGGTRNPANCPTIISSNKYHADNYNFHGMSSLMSARSSLSWDLSEEPFITYFNLGNGKFFNFEGQCQHSKEWYNISAQDYLPTWHFWFANSILGRSAADVPASGLDAEYTWDDAWFGGSTLRIHGTTAHEFLHLFKTEYIVKAGDVITFRYKLRKGSANVSLFMSAKGSETTRIAQFPTEVLSKEQLADEDVWEVRQFTIPRISSKTVALVALEFEGAEDLDLLLGEFSIVRGSSATPATPVLAKAQTLSYNKEGLDAKIIWNMPNTKAVGEPCYNQDVNTSMFKVYAQQEGHEPIFMGVCTSWADLIYKVPVDVTVQTMKVRYGVSALSLDHKSESPIAWSNYETVGNYVYDEDIQINKTVIKPGEAFTIGYVDPKHENATWRLRDTKGNVVYTATDCHDFTVSEGLTTIGSYNLEIEEPVKGTAGPTTPANPNHYSIKLSDTDLYLSTTEVPSHDVTTYSLSATPEYFDIQPSGNGYTIQSGSTGKYVGYNHISTWDLSDHNDVWQIGSLEGVSTTIFKNAAQGLGVDTKVAGMGVYSDKSGTRWIIRHPSNDVKPTTVTRSFSSYVQISSESVGAVPEIYTLTANGKEEGDITVGVGQQVQLAYTGRNADGAGSQGVDLQEQRFGATASDLGIVGAKSFSVGFWLKINELAEGETQLFSVANKKDSWPKTDWGWIWVNLRDNGAIGSFTIRGSDSSSNNEIKYAFGNTMMPIGNWVHVGLAFDYNSNGAVKARFFLNGEEQEATDVSRTTAVAGSPDANGYHSQCYNITNGQVLAIGGDAFGRNGIKGAVDNVIVWNQAVDAATMKTAMGDIDPNRLASNVTAFWDLETKASANNTFTSKGQKQISAGCHNYAATGSEGQGQFGWIESAYTSGCPFISGTAFPVVTKPIWKYKKADMTEPETNSGQQGQATFAWKQAGDYNVVLTLLNSLGQATRTFSTIHVVEGVQGDVNGDGDINVGDLTALVAFILGNPAAGHSFAAADLNGDGTINVTDYTLLVTKILTGE